MAGRNAETGGLRIGVGMSASNITVRQGPLEFLHAFVGDIGVAKVQVFKVS